MFSRVKIAIRFFFVGLAVGILLAPRSGRETRRLVRERADRLLNDVLDAATLGTFDSTVDTDTDGTGETGDREAAEAGRGGAKNANGRSRGRAGSQSSASTAQA